MTLMDFLTKPELTEAAWKYFREVQGMETEYEPMIPEDEQPAIYLNTEIMDEFKPQLEPFYYDEEQYDTYLEQLGITYPTIKSE